VVLLTFYHVRVTLQVLIWPSEQFELETSGLDCLPYNCMNEHPYVCACIFKQANVLAM